MRGGGRGRGLGHSVSPLPGILTAVMVVNTSHYSFQAAMVVCYYLQIRMTLSSSEFAMVSPFSTPVDLGSYKVTDVYKLQILISAYFYADCPPPEVPSKLVCLIMMLLWHLASSCIWDVSHNIIIIRFIGVYFELNGRMYSNNSHVSITEVGEGENALLCKTNKKECCSRVGNRCGAFYYPNEVEVPSKKYNHGFYRNRGDQVVRLHRRVNEEVDSPTGVYCCKVPDACEVEQKICIELHS